MRDSKIYDKIQKALLKRALGFDTSETVEEYAKDGEDMAVVRKRVTTKNVPPDISAVKMYLENFAEKGDDLSNMTSAQLEAEKKRLIALLKENGLFEIS